MAETIVTKTVVELEKLGLYHQLEKAYVDAGLAKKWESATFDEATRKVSFYTVPQPSGETSPVFEFTLPEVDFTEVNNAIKAEADRAKAAEATLTQAIADEKTRAEAAEKVNSDAIAAINNADTGILAQAKTYADGKDVAIQAAKDAADAAQADVDALEAKVGTVPEDKTVVQMISEAITAATYDDTAVKASIKANTDAITVLNGDGEGSVSKQVADAVASIVADAPEAYNTLKEISDWISSHADDAAAMNSQINTNKTDIAGLKTLIGTLPESAASTTIVEYIAEAIGASSTDLTNAIATAKNEAIASAKTYTDTEIGKTNANVSANTEAIANAQADATSALNQIAAIQYATEEDIRGLFA